MIRQNRKPSKLVNLLILVFLAGFVEGKENLQIVFNFEPNIRHLLDLNRPDVVSIYKQAPIKCGFKLHATIGRNFIFGVVINDILLSVASIIFEAVDVLEGNDGYLFLDHDSNKSLEQYKGNHRINKINLITWYDLFSKLNKIKSSKFKHVFLLAPSKEYIYPDYYPAWKLGVTPVYQFLSAFSDENNIVYPIDLLIDQRKYSYSKTDTHWTHYAKAIVEKKICDNLGVDFDTTNLSYKFLEVSGDLGRKFIPPKKEFLPVIDFNFTHKYIVFHNNVNNRGEMSVFVNSDAAVKETCVVFGDSFSPGFVNLLSMVSHRVVFIFSGADLDYSILYHENPAYVISEITTRFLIRAPNPTYSIKDDLSRKAKSSSSIEIDAILKNMDKYMNTDLSFYAELTVEGLKTDQ